MLALEDSFNSFDISPKLFETKHFKYGDKPTFKLTRKVSPHTGQHLIHMFLNQETMKLKLVWNLKDSV